MGKGESNASRATSLCPLLTRAIVREACMQPVP